MSLVTMLSNLATRVGTEFKSLRTLLNGNAADLSGLDTTVKTDLVSAINEVVDSVASASGIDDGATSSSTSWSSSKTASEIAGASTADRARDNHTGTQAASTVDETSTRKWLSDVERTKLAGVAAGATANQTDSYLLARGNHTGSQPVSTLSDFPGAVDARIESRLGTAPANLDTLTEIADRLGQDSDALAALTTGLASRVRFDAAQALTAPQAAQARSNVGAAAAADVGDTATNFVSVFEAALV